MAEEKDLKAQLAEHDAAAKNESLHPDVREHHRAQAAAKRAKKNGDEDRAERTGNK